MSDISQVEHTAMETDIKEAAGRVEGRLLTRELAYEMKCREGWLGRGWRLGRDYERERERALEAALEGAEDFIERVEKWSGSDPDEMHEALATVRHALAASQPEVLSERSDTEPGEPEGQQDTTAEALNRRYAQPDHGPGEPSDVAAKAADALRKLNDEAVSYYGPGWTTDQLLRRTQPIIATLSAQERESNG